MSVYLTKNGKYRFGFISKGRRYSKSGFKTKKEARKAEAKLREELEKPTAVAETPTDMAFLELINLRLDHVKAYNSKLHYQDTVYLARHWVKQWGKLLCSKISYHMVKKWILKRSRVSYVVANKELRNLRALFNFGKNEDLIKDNPTDGIGFLPVEERRKYIPPSIDVDLVIEIADPDTQDYLWAIRETMARVGEINKLKWDHVDLENRCLDLYTRKKRGGNLTPRKVPLTNQLCEVLDRRYAERDESIPFVFWHKQRRQPYQNRNKLMRRLCEKAGVRHFGFHALRHAGASIMDNNNVPTGAIQRLLGHKNRSTTEIYLQSIGDIERLAMQAYEQARMKSDTQSNTPIEKALGS